MAVKHDQNMPVVAEALANERAEFEAQTPERRMRDRERNEKFIELYLERSTNFDIGNYGQMLKSCYQDAGWPLYKTAMYDARQCLSRNWPHIEKALRERLSGASPIAINTLITLCTEAKQEAVRLKAATELLNKGGFAEVQKVQITSAEELSDEELQKQIQEAMSINGLRVVKA